MNGTPRLDSAFPITPQSGPRAGGAGRSTPLQRVRARQPLPRAPADGAAPAPAPLVPLDLVDTGSQRLAVVSCYVLLWAWRISDAWTLYASDDTESLWLFMKWVAIDGIFIFGLPALRIPWLEWSSFAMTVLFLFHATLDAMMMFQIGIPILYWMELLFKTFYDRELAIAERRVKPADVVDHASLFLGKQVINILPEGSALLNPENEVFCLSGTSSQVQLPIQINQTIPYLIELLRQDFDGDTWEVISIKSSEAKKMRKVALKQQKPVEAHDPLLLRYAVKKPGRYTIGKIVDESQLEVRPRISEIFVVSCPSARIKPLRPNRCRGDLSDIAFAVEGTPPLKIKYRKSVNGNSMEASFQGIQPEDFTSPLARRQNTDLARSDWVDVAWAGQKEVIVPVNETMSTVGKYKYTIEEVQDALGNKVVYSKASDEDDKENYKTSETKKIIVVDDRPVIWVPRQASCNAERPLKVAKGKAAQLPHKITSVGRTEKEVEMSRKDDYPFLEDHVIEYEFIPEKSLSNANSSENDRRLLKLTKRSSSMPIPIQEPGLYTLMSIRTDHCQGEVSEPSSCLLQNPIEPTVKIDSAGISDKCAGNPVGLRLTFDFEGSPPFTVKYLSEQEGQKTINYYSQQFPGLRGQLELVPPEAGHYSYKFTEVKDQYYESIPLQDLELSHDVKPSASAQIEYPPQGGLNLCKGDPAIFNIKLSGEAPWTLEYEVIHGKSRKKDRITEINTPTYTLVLNDLGDGGEYTLQVTSVTDKTNCKEFLKLEQPFHIWSQRPTASFGEIEGKRAVHVLEGKSLRLPLRFTGQNAFNYVIKHQESGEDFTQSSAHASGVFEVSKRGTYEILTVQDVHCPGVVDEGSNKFTMDWIGRPSLSLAQSPTVELKKSKYTKQDVCEGDEDYVELAFQGAPPFDVKYEEHVIPYEGPKHMRRKELNAALGTASIQLDTGKAGKYEYRFLEIADNNYNPDAKHQSGLVLQQTVNARPSARFTKPGSTYSYCATESSDEEFIPITFTGMPPFNLDVDLKYSGSASPESINIPNIRSNHYNLRLPQKHLIQGHSHLTIRRVRDSRGCLSKVDPATPLSKVQISVHDPPSIIALETTEHFCIGDRLSFRLSGVPPFTVLYTFENRAMKATLSSTTFRRLAERSGEFVITGVSDSGSNCKFPTQLEKTIHPLPKAKISKGRETHVDIHEGSETEILFEFTGTPPFEFTYTRSENSRKSKKGAVLETKTARTNEFSMRVKASEEGTYEVISVRDKWCAVSRATSNGEKKGQKLLT